MFGIQYTDDQDGFCVFLWVGGGEKVGATRNTNYWVRGHENDGDGGSRWLQTPTTHTPANFRLQIKQHLWRASRDELHFIHTATIPRHTHDAGRICGYSRWTSILLDECRGCRELGRWIKRNSNSWRSSRVAKHESTCSWIQLLRWGSSC